MTEVQARVGVIIDLVGSRQHPNRQALQRIFESTLREVNRLVVAEQPLHPTVGDEAQGRYRTVQDAVDATWVLRLSASSELDCRIGIGVGAIEEVGHTGCHPIEDGPGWWRARDAINVARARQLDGEPTARVAMLFDRDGRQTERPGVNELLGLRDQSLARLDGSARTALLTQWLDESSGLGSVDALRQHRELVSLLASPTLQ